MNELNGKPDRDDPRRRLLIKDLEKVTASWLQLRKDYKKYDKDCDKLRRLGFEIEGGEITNWSSKLEEKVYDEDDMIKAWRGWIRWILWKRNAEPAKAGKFAHTNRIYLSRTSYVRITSYKNLYYIRWYK